MPLEVVPFARSSDDDARPAPRRVLAIGAHPDDVEIGVGGILLRHRAAGDEVHVLTLSAGAHGGDAVRRHEESAEAARRLGATLHMGDLPDREMDSAGATLALIRTCIERLRPDAVYTHAAEDNHQDHRAAHSATMAAAWDVPNLFTYQSPSTRVEFAPTLFVRMGVFLEDKVRLLEAYASQAQRGYLQPEMTRASAAYWGRFAGGEPAEPLMVVREVR